MSHKEQVTRYIEEIWNRGRFELLDELVASDYSGATRAEGQCAHQGRDGLRSWVTGLRTLFPDGKRTIEALIAEGDRVVAVVTSRGTHAASGRAVSDEMAHVLELRDGRVARESIYFDVGGALKRLQA